MSNRQKVNAWSVGMLNRTGSMVVHKQQPCTGLIRVVIMDAVASTYQSEAQWGDGEMLHWRAILTMHVK